MWHYSLYVLLSLCMICILVHLVHQFLVKPPQDHHLSFISKKLWHKMSSPWGFCFPKKGLFQWFPYHSSIFILKQSIGNCFIFQNVWPSFKVKTKKTLPTKEICLKKLLYIYLGAVLHNRIIVGQTVTALKTEKLPCNEEY